MILPFRQVEQLHANYYDTADNRNFIRYYVRHDLWLFCNNKEDIGNPFLFEPLEWRWTYVMKVVLTMNMHTPYRNG